MYLTKLTLARFRNLAPKKRKEQAENPADMQPYYWLGAQVVDVTGSKAGEAAGRIMEISKL